MNPKKKQALPKTIQHQPVRFVLDGELIDVNDYTTNQTLLEYLRDTLQRKGTKEGCAEGDCGACTVVLGQLSEDKESIQLSTSNACLQYLPTLDGKQVFTVESLGSELADLHPVQRSLVEHHGSQCGFCTPGFVMSLFWLYKNKTQTCYQELLEVLSGNICRCTGYRSILDAGLHMYKYASSVIPTVPNTEDKNPEAEKWMSLAGPSPTQNNANLALLKRCVRKTTFAQYAQEERQDPSKLHYLAPQSTEDLASIVLDRPDATLLAGGTDIGVSITKAFTEFPLLVYTGNIKALKKIKITANQTEVGSAVTLSQIIPTLLSEYPELEDFFKRFASLPIRNIATLAGNICNASPVGDSIPLLLCLDSHLKLRTGNSHRVLPLSEFYLGYQKTALQTGEFLESIQIPRRGQSAHLASFKVSKRHDQDISAVCAAFYLKHNDRSEHSIKIAYGGMAAIPKRATATEDFINNNHLNTETILQAMNILKQEFTPLSDFRASAEYRSKVAGNLLYRFLNEVIYPDTPPATA